jgi:hypothetical protein
VRNAPPHELFLDLGCYSFALLLRVARGWYHNTRNGAAKWERPEFKSLEITIYRKKTTAGFEPVNLVFTAPDVYCTT